MGAKDYCGAKDQRDFGFRYMRAEASRTTECHILSTSLTSDLYGFLTVQARKNIPKAELQRYARKPSWR